MAEWQNDRMTEWQNGRMTEWQNDRMTEWQNDRMAEWQNGRMAEWHVVSFNLGSCDSRWWSNSVNIYGKYKIIGYSNYNRKKIKRWTIRALNIVTYVYDVFFQDMNIWKNFY